MPHLGDLGSVVNPIPIPDSPKSSTPLKKFSIIPNDEKATLENGGCLSDVHIRAAQSLLQRQFPEQNGLQSPVVLASKLQWKSDPSDFIQIINVGGQHWVCASNINCPPGVVDVYDSIPSYSAGSYTLRKQIASILKTPDSSFQIRFPDVQRQSGGSDCGLFAIAFAVALCFGSDPHLLSFDQQKMRDHLLDCFVKEILNSFPSSSKPRRLARRRVAAIKDVKVYCLCRLPWVKTDRSRGGLIQCRMCTEWFHQICAEINDATFNQPLKYHWYCSTCLDS